MVLVFPSLTLFRPSPVVTLPRQPFSFPCAFRQFLLFLQVRPPSNPGHAAHHGAGSSCERCGEPRCRVDTVRVQVHVSIRSTKGRSSSTSFPVAGCGAERPPVAGGRGDTCRPPRPRFGDASHHPMSTAHVRSSEIFSWSHPTTPREPCPFPPGTRNRETHRKRPRETIDRNSGPPGGQDLLPLRCLPYLTVSNRGAFPRGPKILTCVAGFLRDTSPQHRSLASGILPNTSVVVTRFAIEWRI